MDKFIKKIILGAITLLFSTCSHGDYYIVDQYVISNHSNYLLKVDLYNSITEVDTAFIVSSSTKSVLTEIEGLGRGGYDAKETFLINIDLNLVVNDHDSLAICKDYQRRENWEYRFEASDETKYSGTNIYTLFVSQICPK